VVIPRLSISEMNNKNDHGEKERFKLFSADAGTKTQNNQKTSNRYKDDVSAIHWFPNFDILKSRQGTDSINLPLSTQGAETNFMRTTKRQ
jgi:hypothetical protein